MKRTLILIILLTMTWPVFGEHTGGNEKREPTVTKEEAALINQALTLSRDNMKKAIEYLQPVIKAGSSAAMNFALGNFYFQQNNFEPAIDQYQKALKKMPQFDRARANLARIYIQKNQNDKAYEQLKPVLNAGTEKVPVLILAGYIYLLNDQAVPAESAYRKALLTEPDNEQAYNGLAKSLLLQQRYAEAIRLFEEVLAKRPDRKDIWVHLANTRLAAGKPHQAVIALESARRLELLGSDELATLGDLYLNNGQAKEALERYKQAFQHQYKSVKRLLRAIEGFLMVRQLSFASELIDEAEKMDQNNFFDKQDKEKLLWFKAREAQLSGRTPEALKQYKLLLKKDPLNGNVLMAMGELYQQQGAYEYAVLQYQRASNIEDVRIEALVKYAELEVKREHYHKAVELLENAVLLKPSPRLERYLKQVRYLSR